LTVNAIALDLERGVLIDPWRGQEDLAAGVIRAVGDPDARFAEDGLRAMRAIRFATTLEFSMDPATKLAISKAIPTFRKVSVERVREELLKILGASSPRGGLEAMAETGLLREVLPEVVDLSDEELHHTLHVVDATPRRHPLRLAALFLAVTEERTSRRLEALKLPRRDRDHVSKLVMHSPVRYRPDWEDAQIRRFLRDVGPELVADLLALGRASVSGAALDHLEELEARISEQQGLCVPLRVKDLAVDGMTIMQHLELSPGPLVGRILSELLEVVLDDPDANDPDRLLEAARSIIDGLE
jgi:tRNA nucleotidyltransferase (CCA-adding enzyme)